MKPYSSVNVPVPPWTRNVVSSSHCVILAFQTMARSHNHWRKKKLCTFRPSGSQRVTYKGGKGRRRSTNPCGQKRTRRGAHESEVERSGYANEMPTGRGTCCRNPHPRCLVNSGLYGSRSVALYLRIFFFNQYFTTTVRVAVVGRGNRVAKRWRRNSEGVLPLPLPTPSPRKKLTQHLLTLGSYIEFEKRIAIKILYCPLNESEVPKKSSVKLGGNIPGECVSKFVVVTRVIPGQVYYGTRYFCLTPSQLRFFFRNEYVTEFVVGRCVPTICVILVKNLVQVFH